MKIYQVLLVFLFLIGTCSIACGFSARVAAIPDGDTIEVYKPGERFRTTIDLYGIDCPERQQYFGNSAKYATAGLVASKTVEIETISEDQSGRLSAVITVGGKNVNATLVSKGWAWVIPDDCNQPFCDGWRRLEKESRRNRIGLWTAANPQPPWEWRKEGKKELFYILPDKKTPVWRDSP